MLCSIQFYCSNLWCTKVSQICSVLFQCSKLHFQSIPLIGMIDNWDIQKLLSFAHSLNRFYFSKMWNLKVAKICSWGSCSKLSQFDSIPMIKILENFESQKLPRFVQLHSIEVVQFDSIVKNIWKRVTEKMLKMCSFSFVFTYQNNCEFWYTKAAQICSVFFQFLRFIQFHWSKFFKYWDMKNLHKIILISSWFHRSNDWESKYNKICSASQPCSVRNDSTVQNC